VRYATRSGKLDGYVWNEETCGTGNWDGVSASIDVATGISNTYVFYVNDLDDTLHLATSSFEPSGMSITGIVTSTWTGQPVSNAVLTASETSDWTWVTATSASNGAYAITSIPTGRYTVVVKATDYTTLTTNVALTAGNSPYSLAIGLVPVPEPAAGALAVIGYWLFVIRRRAAPAIRQTGWRISAVASANNQ
jgi:hypothetical protein